MKVRELCEACLSELRITYEADPHNAKLEVIIPVCTEPAKILNERFLNLDVHMILVVDDAIVASVK